MNGTKSRCAFESLYATIRKPCTAANAAQAGLLTLIVVAAPLWLGCNKPAAEFQPAGTTSSLPPRAAPTQLAAHPKIPAPRAPRPDDWFQDVTEQSGVKFAYQSGRESGHYTLLETVGGGAALLDYDQDGDLDIYFPGGGSIDAQQKPPIGGRAGTLFRNDGDWRFVDITEQAGLAAPGDYSHGVAVADFDRNGYPDLLETGYGRCRLFKNEGGKFADVTAEAGLNFTGWSTAAAWADINGDSYPDLYIAGYASWTFDPNESCGDRQQNVRDVCPPSKYPGMQDRLFLNQKDGSFGDFTKKAELKDSGKGLGVVAADLNRDGNVDFYVANDVGDNFLYWGGGEFPFQDGALVAGAANEEYGLAQGSMGVDVGDYNGDGIADIFVTNFELENNILYRGEQDAYFIDATLATGLKGTCFVYVGFGAALADFDSDGWDDLLVVNGNVYYATGQSAYEQPSFVFRNVGGKRFDDVSSDCGPYFTTWHAGRGAAVGDLDNDGGLDLVIVRQNAPAILLRNRRPPKRWIRAQLEGVECDREAIGARVLVDDGPRRLTKWVKSGAGYLSQFDPRLVFPLEEDGPVSVTVIWPRGEQEVFSELQPNTAHVLRQGQGKPPS